MEWYQIYMVCHYQVIQMMSKYQMSEVFTKDDKPSQNATVGLNLSDDESDIAEVMENSYMDILQDIQQDIQQDILQMNVFHQMK